MSLRDSRVLVTDAHTTSALATVRSLSAAGMLVTVVAEAGRFSLAAHSKHADRVWTCPPVEQHPRAYLDALVRELESRRYDVLIPTTDSTIAVLMAERDRIERVVTVALPPNAALQGAQDKKQTIEHAKQRGVAVPRTWVCSSLDEVETLAPTLEYPCVVKPRFSRYWSGTGPLVRGTVKYADSAQSLREIVRSSPTGPDSLLVQELVRGIGVGVFALMQDGEARVVFAHRRLREANPTGGRASLAESIPPDDRLIAPAVRLLRSLGWTGVAMVEFKDPGPPAPPVAMEVNGRFWGSLPLAIESGIDFPVLFVQQVLGLPITPPARYAIGVKCRHLAGDLSHLAATFKGRPRWWSGPFPTPLGAIASITPWPGRWHAFNMWASDPMPGLREAGHFVRHAAQRLSHTGGQTLKGAVQKP
jgi:predicted ATP-grasp superfamily ATP-dependent carboligase